MSNKEVYINDFRYYSNLGGYYAVKVGSKLYSADDPKILSDKLEADGYEIIHED